MGSARTPGGRIVGLYPRAWRDRYGDEMAALLGSSPPDLRDRIDLVRGALDAHLALATDAPGRVGVGAALIAGAAWTMAAVASLGAPAPPDWPGYLAETLPLGVIGALAIMLGAVSAARPAWSANALPLESGLVAVVVGHVLWAVALAAAWLGGPYGAITVIATSLAALATAWLGIALMRAGLHPVGEAVAVAGAVMLVPSPAAWLVGGTLWTGIGLWRAADGRTIGTSGTTGIASIASVAIALVLTVAACGATPSSAAPAPADAPGLRIDLVAEAIAFQPPAVTIASGTDFVVHLVNRDDGIPHNVALLADANFTTTLAKGEIVTGPAVVDLAVAGLIPGRYRLMCEVHPNMLVDLTVEP